MKPTLLLVSAGIFHPSLPARAALLRAVQGMSEMEVRQAGSLEALRSSAGKGARALALFIHQQRISEAALSALEQFIDEGGGVLAVHSATASFKKEPRYFRALGGRFTGHGAVERFTASPVEGGAGPFAGLGPFTVRDELYLHELLPGVQAHYTALWRGEQVPVVWSYRRGKGRVCYVCPGHVAASLREPVVVEILRRGMRWAAGLPGDTV